MIKITNGKDVFMVSSGAYEGIYKQHGFYPVAGESPVEAAPEAIRVVVEAPVVDEFAELLEKPLGQWNKEEVRTFVEAKGIDTANAKNVGEVKGLIKAWMDTQE